MPRCGRIRTFIREYKQSYKTEKLSFIPPFLILIVEAVLLIHALTIDIPDLMVVELTTILLIISFIEIILVSYEIHEHYSRTNFDKLLTIRLDDFITETKEKNVKKIVSDFMNNYPDYRKHRGRIYHTACQILETHRKEAIDKELYTNLDEFYKKNKKENVDEILNTFLKKYPKYSKYSTNIYKRVCTLKEKK